MTEELLPVTLSDAEEFLIDRLRKGVTQEHYARTYLYTAGDTYRLAEAGRAKPSPSWRRPRQAPFTLTCKEACHILKHRRHWTFLQFAEVVHKAFPDQIFHRNQTPTRIKRVLEREARGISHPRVSRHYWEEIGKYSMPPLT